MGRSHRFPYWAICRVNGYRPPRPAPEGTAAPPADLRGFPPGNDRYTGIPPQAAGNRLHPAVHQRLSYREAPTRDTVQFVVHNPGEIPYHPPKKEALSYDGIADEKTTVPLLQMKRGGFYDLCRMLNPIDFLGWNLRGMIGNDFGKAYVIFL